MTTLTDSRLANLGARAIHAGMEQYRARFKAITQQAKPSFETADWPRVRANALERLELYRLVVDEVVASVAELLDDRLRHKLVWAGMKAVYSGLIADHDDWELAETFYNSITRRIFNTVGVDPQIEFVSTDFETPPTQAAQPVYRVYGPATALSQLVEEVLLSYEWRAPFADLRGDARQASRKLAGALYDIGAPGAVERLEMAEYPFFRGMAAYLVGRLFSRSLTIPFVLALLRTEEGLKVDKLILDEAGCSILFSFARSYFHVMVERPYDLVQFLKGIMPRKRVAELYISLGFNKHGKTELYRDILHHMAGSNERFQLAQGQRGMVMLVFDMPNYDLVFKIIKDQFDQPKRITRQEVLDKYEMVFKHDRAGRLIDAQSFEHLQFDRRRFSEELLAELLDKAAKTARLEDEWVALSHLYIERRVIPLDIYVETAHETAAEAAVIEYGQAIKDLAATNIFPGDMLLKNFGVTRHGRIVFYDYDELTDLLSRRSRKIPASAHYEDELSDQPWFSVAENDVFPEEFVHFIGLSGRLRDAFMGHHADLFEVAFWQETQARIRAGELIHIFPYKQG
jgi:isocitrate dehydrogenase kinase/phosphatase